MFKFLKEEEETNGTPAPTGAPAAAPANIADAPPANGAAPSGGTPPAEGTPPASWLDSLPDDIKKDPSLAMFKEPAALAKSWISAQKMIGADKVIIPGEKASDEEKAAFYQKIGRPASADKYDVKLPEGYKLDDATLNSVKETAFKLGFTPAQLAGVIEFDAQRTAAAMEAGKANQLNEIRASLAEYQKTLGGEDKYKAKVDLARSAVQELATPELKKFLVDTQLGSRPEMIEFFANLRGMMGDGKLRDGTGTNFGIDPSIIQAEINSIEDPKSPLWDASHPQRQSFVDKRNKLYERLSAAQSGTV